MGTGLAMRVGTIAARNYLPRAQLLARSYQRHHPGQRLVIMLVDARPGEYADTDHYEIRTAQDLDLPLDEYHRMAMIYDITEFSTSLKPWFLQSLLDGGAHVAVYLDPDVVVYGGLSEVATLAAERGIVLTPHTTGAIPRDGLHPTETGILQSGVYNLGFIAVPARSGEFLRWWMERLRRDCVNAPANGLFVDQRWIDLIPGLFEHVVLRDPGYNVAYWNLHDRRLTREGAGIVVNGRPLRFFHFSGYLPEASWSLSKYCPDPRVLLSEQPVVRELCDRYAADLRASARPVPDYRFDCLEDGTPVTGTLRLVYRQALIAAETAAQPLPPPPFGVGERDWFREPVQENGRLNRVLHGIWQLRPDLRGAFPDPLRTDQDKLIDWAWDDPHVLAELPRTLLPARRLSRRGAESVGDHDAGVTVAGYFRAEMGVGQMGRLLLEAVRSSGLRSAVVTNRRTASRQDAPFADAGGDAPQRYPVTIAAVNADQFPAWHEEFRAESPAAVARPAPTAGQRRPGSYTIGMWAWEVEQFPCYSRALELVDEIWTLSEFAREAIAATTDKPVHTIPLPCTAPGPSPEVDRVRLGMSSAPYFLFMFDYLSVFARKNPLAVVEAFRRACPDEGRYQLVIKAVNGDRYRLQRERLRLACHARRDIVLIEDYLDQDDVGALLSGATAYVSLHRAEGYGLTIAEAMVRGVPVIATAYSGNLDFTTADNSLLVPYQRVKVGPGAEPYAADGHWAEPDIGAAATHLRWVIEHPQEARRLGAVGRASLLTEHSLDRTARFVHERVSSAYRSLDGDLPTTPSTPAAPDLRAAVDAARRRSALPADVHSPARRPRLAALSRRLVYRALRHHDERDRAVHSAVLDAVEAVELRTIDPDRLAEVAARVAALEERDAMATRMAARRAGNAEADLRALRREVTALHANVGDLRARLDKLTDAVDGSSARADDTRSRALALSATLAERVDGVSADLARITAELVASPYTAVEDALRIVSPDGERQMGYESTGGPLLDGYLGFEDIFRGSEDFITERMRVYLPLLRDKEPVLDVGCGRGELLRVLAAAGVTAGGVDLDPGMVERCQGHGLDVQLADAVETLAAAPEKSLGAVTAVQMVEHLAPRDLRMLFESAFRALCYDGVLLAETVNPHSPAALKAFWVDLAHVRPFYPEALLMLARECGFGSARIVFPNGTGDLQEDLRACGEYALVAVKRS